MRIGRMFLYALVLYIVPKAIIFDNQNLGAMLETAWLGLTILIEELVYRFKKRKNEQNDGAIESILYATAGGEYFIDVTDDESGVFTTNLPSKRQQGKCYAFRWYDFDTVLYTNTQDESECFFAYKIKRVDDNTLSVYCFSDGNTYQLFMHQDTK